jgi:hypothetical protein
METCMEPSMHDVKSKILPDSHISENPLILEVPPPLFNSVLATEVIFSVYF